MKLKAKCPHCFGEKPDCPECHGTGKIDVEFPEDDWYTRHCLNPLCGFDNGGCSGKALRDEKYPCVMCGHPEVTWIPMCESSNDPPWKTHQTNDFAKYLIAMEQRESP